MVCRLAHVLVLVLLHMINIGAVSDLAGMIFAATSSPSASVTTTADHGCVVGTVGLIDAKTGEWNSSSCIKVDWADDAETASVVDNGKVMVYVTPADGSDTFIATVDFSRKNVTAAIVGGDQGNLRCSLAGKCYGVNTDPTVLVEVDGHTGDSRNALRLKKYGGFSVDSSAVDPGASLYHAVLVGEPHILANGEKSNQYLVTIDLKTMKIRAEVPIGRNFMGPLVVSKTAGLLTFGSDRFTNSLTAVDYKTGKQRQALSGYFGTVYLFTAGFSADRVFATNLFPQPSHFFAVDTSKSPATVVTNVTFNQSVHALAAAW